MSHYRNFMEIQIEKQAERITKLNEELAKAKQLEKYELAGKYYLTLSKLVQENPILQDDWNRFLCLIKLSCEADEVKWLGG